MLKEMTQFFGRFCLIHLILPTFQMSINFVEKEIDLYLAFAGCAEGERAQRKEVIMLLLAVW